MLRNNNVLDHNGLAKNISENIDQPRSKKFILSLTSMYHMRRIRGTGMRETDNLD